MTLSRRANRVSRWRLYLPVLLGLLLGLTLTILARDLIQRQVDRDARQELQQRTDFIAAAINSRMQTYGNALTQMRGLLALLPALDQAQLEAYVAHIDLMGRYPGLRGIGLARRIAATDIPQHVQSMRAQGIADYHVFPDVKDGEAFPVVLLAPLDPTSRAIIGFDMFSEKVRHAGMLAAAASGSTQLSGAVHLKSGPDISPSLGCMLYVPVYRPGAPIGTLAERLNATTGIFYSPFRTQDLFNGIFGSSSTNLDHEVAYRIYDGEVDGPDTLLYDREQAFAAKLQERSGPGMTREVLIAGRSWTLVVSPLPGLYHGLATRLPMLVFLAGLTFSLLLTRVLYGYAAQSLRDRQGRRRAEAAAARARLLAQCGSILNSSVKGQSNIQRVAELVVADLAEICSIHLAGGNGELQLGILAEKDLPSSADYEQQVLTREVSRTFDRRGEQLFHSEVRRLLRRPDSPFAPAQTMQASSAVLSTVMSPELRAAQVGSFVAVPLNVRGRCHGVMTFIRSRRHTPYCQEDLAYGEEVAGRVAMALDNAQLYVDIRAAKEQAEAANRAKSTFLANISHEIRTPLGAVLGFADMLQDPLLDEKERSAFTATIVRNAQELSRLIDDLLDLSKVEAGKLDIERLPTRILDVLTDIKISLGLRAREKGIELAIEIDEQVPEQVLTDPTRLRQILLNMIGNALKFTVTGRVEVGVCYRPAAGEAALVEFRVKDTGPGIALESQSGLFQPFTQADASTTRRYGGTGLGLVLSRMLARALGGDVALEHSVVGEGSTFVVTIGCARVVAGAEAAPPHWASRKDKGELSRGKKLAGLHLLLAEDLPDNQLLITRLLKGSGAKVDVVDNGVAAVQAATTGDYDLILMDLQMPQLDGFGATTELRRLGLTVPIVALTAHALREERDKCLAAGCDDHLTKPVDPHILVGTVAYFTASRLLHKRASAVAKPACVPGSGSLPL